jgi:alkylation response protein AidB-like acyl-CoA dehydrogenase
MNYDFSEKESSLFKDLSERIGSLAASHPIEEGGAPEKEKSIRSLLSLLAETPYLQLGMSQVEGMNGRLSLMGAMEVFSAISPSVHLSVEASTRLFGGAVADWGSEKQRERWLFPLMKGDILGALALSETAAGTEDEVLATNGEKQGDDALNVNGAKEFVINAPIADWIAVAGICEGSPALFVLERNTDGLEFSPPLETTGYEGTPIAGLRLLDCRLPMDQVLFPPEGERMTEYLRMREDFILLGASIGLCKAGFETARDFAKSHKSGGKPLIAQQKVGFKLAEMLTLLQTSELLAFRTAWSLDADPAGTRELLFCAKVFCTEAAERIASEAVKIMGGRGCVFGNPADRALRCAKFCQIAGTPIETARIAVGDSALGYRE